MKRLWCRRTEGQDLVEYALVLPLLILLLLGIVEFSLAVWQYDTVANVAREVARCGIIYGNDVNGHCIPVSINNFGLGVPLTAGNFTVTWPGDRIRVQIDYDYQPITGLIIGGTLPLRTVSTMRNEY